MNIIGILKRSKAILNLCSFCYNVVYSPSLLKLYFNKNVIIKGTFLKSCKIKSIGGAHIKIGSRTIMNHCVIVDSGKESHIIIDGGATNIKNSSFIASMPNGNIIIANGFTSEGCNLKAHEGKTISVGYDCMFSAGINMSTTDFHAIISKDRQMRINPAKDISIGNHVWLCRNVTILKGASITDDVIVGVNSMLAHTIDTPHSVWAGAPAKKIKEGTTWRRSLN